MERYARAREIAALDPDRDRIEIVRRMVQFEFPWDMMRSLELALFRTFAVPTIGTLLDRTREFGDHTQKRYDDTLLLLYHIWLDDTADERRASGEHLNFLHDHYRISNDDFRYTLATFVVVPIRWLRRYGWRAPSDVEITAWTNAMRDMGQVMRIDGMPATFDEFCELLDKYEAEYFAYQPANERVARATLDMMVGWYPRPLRPAMRALVPGLLDEPVLRAVGLPVPSRRMQRLADGAVRARARVLRRLPARPDDKAFEPKLRTYDTEPAMRDLGPVALLRRR
ncbi:MAG TPA: oxygenase MpaB family protein [Jatrophihabitantaceae bacterium]|nr:oxygenase MpaB family protein [Jatrophihabitantaceae bacterium]